MGSVGSVLGSVVISYQFSATGVGVGGYQLPVFCMGTEVVNLVRQTHSYIAYVGRFVKLITGNHRPRLWEILAVATDNLRHRLLLR